VPVGIGLRVFWWYRISDFGPFGQPASAKKNQL
jgi:hypothetical protein